jgi:FkbM family methyltransferase
MAFEPIPETFALLANNVRGFKYKNVTLFNAALSNQTQVVGFDIPTFDTGLQNYYEAHIAKPSESSDAVVLSIQLNEIGINNKIALVKVDAEGHEDSVIEGMTNILHRDKPTLILENASPELREMLTKIGYKAEVFAGSPNVLFRFGGKAN